MARRTKDFYKRAHVLLVLLIFITFSAIFYVIKLPQKAGSAVARTNSTTCSNAGDTIVSCTLSSPTNGNTLVAVIGTRGSTADRVTSITQTGATWQRATQSTNSNGVTVEVWYANNISGAGTGITINLAVSMKASAVVAQYSGVLTSSILDKTASSTGNNTSPSTGTTTTTSQSNQLWVGGMANIGTDLYSAQNNSFTEVAEVQSTTGNANTKNNTVMYEKFVTATGTASVSSTLAATQQWAGAIATFNATGPPTQIAIVMSPTTLTAGVCSSAMTLETRDSSGAPVNATNGVVIQLSALTSVSAPYFYTTSNCSGGSVTSFTFNGSESSKTFYMKDTKALVNAQVLATKISGTDTLSDYTLTYTVTASTMTKLGIRLPGQDINGYNNGQALGTPSSQTAGTSFTITEIRALDAFDNTVASYSGSKTLSYSGPGLAPNGSSTAPSYTTTVNFTNGLSTTTLTTTLYKAETTTITVTDGGLYGSATASLTIAAGALSAYDVSIPSGIYTAGVCSNAKGTSTILAKDVWNNTRTQDTSVINLTANGSISFYQSKTCTSPGSQVTLSSGTVDFSFMPTKSTGLGFRTITATKNGDTINGSSFNFSVEPGSISTILVALPGQSFTDGTGITGGVSFTGIRTPNATAGTSFNVSLYAIDSYNNILDSGTNEYTGAKTISWANSTAGNAPSGTTPSYPATSVTFSGGTSTTTLTATYYLATTSRNIRADASSPSVNGTASTNFTVQAGAKANYDVSASTPQTAGVAFNAVITARDNYNNNLGSLYSAPSGAYGWSTTASNAPDGTTPSIGSLANTDFTNGVATKSVTLYKAESGVTFTASEPGPSSVTGISSSITVNPGQISANSSDSTITASASGPTNTNIAIYITLRDTWRNPKSSVEKSYITISATGSPTITQPSSNTDSSGTTLAYASWPLIGVYTVNVNINTVQLVQNDGISAYGSGLLEATKSITITDTFVPSSILRSGTVINGGSIIQ